MELVFMCIIFPDNLQINIFFIRLLQHLDKVLLQKKLILSQVCGLVFGKL